MSHSALQAFLSSAAADGQLRQKLQAAAGVDDIVALASSHGHAFSKATLLKAHAAAISSAPDHRLEAINSWGDALNGGLRRQRPGLRAAVLSGRGTATML